jgi:hypothetical protein
MLAANTLTVGLPGAFGRSMARATRCLDGQILLPASGPQGLSHFWIGSGEDRWTAWSISGDGFTFFCPGTLG